MKVEQVEEEVEEVRRWNTCTNKSGSMRACYDWAPACLVQLGSCSFGTLGLLLVLVPLGSCFLNLSIRFLLAWSQRGASCMQCLLPISLNYCDLIRS